MFDPYPDFKAEEPDLKKCTKAQENADDLDAVLA